MNRICYRTALAAFVLLAGLDLARGADRVLVPGNPPLTQEMVDLEIASYETLSDLSFSDGQRREYQRLLTEEWRGMNPAQKQSFGSKSGTSPILVRFSSFLI
jgi:hypothetical protein